MTNHRRQTESIKRPDASPSTSNAPSAGTSIDHPDPIATWTLLTPGTADGAVAILHLRGDIDEALRRLAPSHLAPVSVGSMTLRPLAGVDTALIARWAPDAAQIMPHGGSLVIRELAAALERAGIRRRDLRDLDDDALRAMHPQASDEIEARMLDALARAHSPRSVDLLLDQPRRWSAHRAGTVPAPDADHSRVLRRLIDPPLVVAMGPSNIGKSTLINALAGRDVSIVADEPGTTRDHVGVMMDFDGLVVRYADTPGVRPDPDDAERDALAIAIDLARRADLLLLCGDADAPPVNPFLLHPELASVPSIRVALRVDRAEPAWTTNSHGDGAGITGAGFVADGPSHVGIVRTSAVDRRGLDDLARAIRSALVPDTALTDPRPWRFWEIGDPHDPAR